MGNTIHGKLKAELYILEKIIEKGGYESLLDFFEQIDSDKKLESIKKALKDFHNNKSRLYIIKNI